MYIPHKFKAHGYILLNSGFITYSYFPQIIKEFLRIGVNVYIAGCDGMIFITDSNER